MAADLAVPVAWYVRGDFQRAQCARVFKKLSRSGIRYFHNLAILILLGVVGYLTYQLATRPQEVKIVRPAVAQERPAGPPVTAVRATGPAAGELSGGSHDS